MKTRATLALAVMAGLPAAVSAQETFSVIYSWNEVMAGTINAPATPNSVVDPGEAARIRVGVTALVNGSNAVGQTASYTDPAPGGTGTIRGLGAVVYDLLGDNGAATADGVWGGFVGGLAGATAPLNTGSSGGAVPTGNNGNLLAGFGGSQFVVPGQSASTANNNQQVLRGVWQPNSYANRTVNWVAKASSLVPTGQQNSVLLAYGIGTDPGTGEEFDLLVGKYFGSSFGQGVNIPIAPAPSSLALLGMGALVAGGRRRR